GLTHSSSRRTEGRRRSLDGLQYSDKHRAGLLPEKPLRCGRSVRTPAQEVVDRCQPCTLSGVVKSSKLVMPQREVPVAPFHIRAGTLEPLRKLGGFRLQLVLLHQAQLAQRPTRRKQRCAEALGTRPPWLARCHRPGRRHALEIIRGNEMCMHG